MTRRAERKCSYNKDLKLYIPGCNQCKASLVKLCVRNFPVSHGGGEYDVKRQTMRDSQKTCCSEGGFPVYAYGKVAFKEDIFVTFLFAGYYVLLNQPDGKA